MCDYKNYYSHKLHERKGSSPPTSNITTHYERERELKARKI